jgi:hypothetical protein
MGTNNFLGILDCWLNPHKAFKETETFKLGHYPKAGLIYANKISKQPLRRREYSVRGYRVG